jgi:CheY-like chemotaxis protein
VGLASELRPDAVTLDLRLPDIHGLRVLSRLKADLATRHLPVHVVSTDEEAERARALGAFGVLAKPVPRREALDELFAALRRQAERGAADLLALSDREGELCDLLAGPDLRVRCAASPEEAVRLAEEGAFAAGVVDARVAGGAAAELARELRERSKSPLPVVLYEPTELPRAAEPVTLGRGGVRASSPVELLDAVALLAHRPIEALPAAKRAMLEALHERSAALAGRKVLVVDDDVRNIFAMTSVLEKQEMVVLSAENGQAALDLLESTPDVAVVLMDIMMPGMDGFDTMRAVRKIPALRSLPIIAVTAKAMKGDRERTLEAGAWDYLSKPVEPDRMLSVLRAWLRG